MYISYLFLKLKKHAWEFHGCLVVGIPGFHCSSPGSIPVPELTLCKPCGYKSTSDLRWGLGSEEGRKEGRKEGKNSYVYGSRDAYVCTHTFDNDTQ